MNEQYQLKKEEIKVMEDEYNKLLSSLEEESGRYAALKGEYTTI